MPREIVGKGSRFGVDRTCRQARVQVGRRRLELLIRDLRAVWQGLAPRPRQHHVQPFLGASSPATAVALCYPDPPGIIPG